MEENDLARSAYRFATASSDIATAPPVHRVVWGMFSYALAMALLATLSPFEFSFASPHRLDWAVLPDDAALNFLLLLPTGFLLAAARGTRMPTHCAGALAFGLVTSAALEALQLTIPTRYASPVDVLLNGLGAWVGAYAQKRIGGFLARVVTETRVLELPVTGALYVLAPLLFVGSLAATDRAGALTQLPLGAFLSTVGAALYQHRFAQTGAPRVWAFSAFCAGSFGMLEAVLALRHPGPFLVCVALVFLLSWASCTRSIREIPQQRRFEASTARRALPWLVLYFLLSASTRSAAVSTQIASLRMLETCAACTLLGYVVSELFARTTHSSRLVVLGIAGLGAAEGALASRGVAMPVLLAACAAAGALLHRTQTSLVRALRRASSPATAHKT